MYKQHNEFRNDKIVNLALWRYMDLWKFLDLLKSSKLYFPNVNNFGDLNEGRIPEKIFNMMEEDSIKQFGNTNFAETYKVGLEQYRPRIFISSWTSSQSESFAFWKMYAKDKLGVAVKSNFKLICDSFLNFPEDIYIGEVNYYNNLEPYYRVGNIYIAYLTKHDYYSFESEVRCIYVSRNDLNLAGISIDIKLDVLIEEIYISKQAYNVGLEDVIKAIFESKGYSIPIKISGINDNWL